MTRHLFGIPGAEHLFDDIADAYEAQVEPWIDEHDDRWQIEEHTSRLAHDDVPTPERVVEWVAEAYAEGDMAPDDDGVTYGKIKASPDVVAAATALVNAVKAAITYRWADEVVAVHDVALVDGEPCVDGSPLYRNKDGDR